MSIPVHFNGSLLNIMSGGGITPPSDCPSPTTILSQAFDSTGNAVLSQFDPGGGGTDIAKAFENFSFVAGAMVTDLHWTGGIADPPAEPSITAWLIEFWNDAGGQPGTLAQTAVFSPALANQTLLGHFGTLTAYTYSVDILPWFLADAGVTYWVSVQPRLVFPPSWGWATAGAGSSWQIFLGTGASQPFNLAMAITGCTGTPSTNFMLMENGTDEMLMENGTDLMILE